MKPLSLKEDDVNSAEIKRDGFEFGKPQYPARGVIASVGLIGVMLLCAPTHVGAQVCEAERQAALKSTVRGPGEWKPIEMRADGLTATIKEVTEYNPIRDIYPDVSTNLTALREHASVLARTIRTNRAPGGVLNYAAMHEFQRCLVLAQIEWLERGSNPASGNTAKTTNPTPPAIPAPLNSSASANQAAQEEHQRQRNATASKQLQELTNRRLEQEASVAKEVAKRRAEIQAEVNKPNAITWEYEEGSCPPVGHFINHTKVALTAEMWFTMQIRDATTKRVVSSATVFMATAVLAHDRELVRIPGAPDCDSVAESWSIPSGGIIKWNYPGW